MARETELIYKFASAPTATDDVNAGYELGDDWLDTSTGITYTCVDNTASAAVWGTILTSEDIGSMISAAAVYGEVHMQNNATNTVIAAANTPVKVAGVTSNGDSSSDITLGSNIITYTGAETKTFSIEAAANLLRIGFGGNDGTLYIARNGAVVLKSAIQLTMNGQERPAPIQCFLDLAQNDFVEVWVENNTNGNDVRVEHMNLKIQSV